MHGFKLFSLVDYIGVQFIWQHAQMIWNKGLELLKLEQSVI